MKNDTYSNREVARLLRNVAAAYILLSENRFKIIAYEKAADTIEHLNREIHDIWQDGNMDDVPGIGKSLGAHLDELFRTGQSKHFDAVIRKIPPPVFDLMQVPTIGPKTAFKLVRALHLENSREPKEAVKKAGENGRIARIDTFGEKSQAEILEAINRYQQKSSRVERMVLPVAFSLARDVVDYLKKHPAVRRVDMLGSLRRMLSTIGDIDLLVQAEEKDAESIIKYFTQFPKTVKIDNAGGKKASIIISADVRVDLRIQNKGDYGSMLQYFTGSKTHNIELRTYALKKGYSLSEYGIKKVQSSRFKVQKNYQFSNENDFYNFLGLQYIPPEMREGTNEIELAGQKKLPALVEPADIKGDLHTHSSYDLKPSHDLGANTFAQMADKAKELNYEYIGFSEHNPKISGLTEKEIGEIMRRRKECLDKIKFSGIKIFNGLEVDIQPDGRLALPDEAIKYVDYLIVSVHSVFSLDREAMTKRVMKSLQYPKVKILGHPTGRLLNKRDGYELDWPVIFKECQARNIALEINAWPSRLDLPDILVREGLRYGVKYVISTDAHENREMDNLFYGVSVARRGWAKKSDIMNALSSDDFKKWLIEERR